MKVATTLFYLAGLLALGQAAPANELESRNSSTPNSANQYVTITTWSGSMCDGTNQGSTHVHDNGDATCVLMSNAGSFRIAPGLGGPAGTCGHAKAYYYNNFGCDSPYYGVTQYGNNQCVQLGTHGYSHDSAAFVCD